MGNVVKYLCLQERELNEAPVTKVKIKGCERKSVEHRIRLKAISCTPARGFVDEEDINKKRSPKKQCIQDYVLCNVSLVL